MEKKMFKLTCVVGTRPEAIKMAPVVMELKNHPEFSVSLLSTGQHAEMLDGALANFGLVPDVKLSIMKERQSLDYITSRVLEGVGKFLDENPPDMIFVHGDTTTTFASALAAFYRKVPVAHVEAGLRSRDMSQPFPEEANRVLTDSISNLCFAPTEGAKKNLLDEGVHPTKIFVTGNTVIDALFWTLNKFDGKIDLPELAPDAPLVLVTAHRRESWGEPLVEIIAALRELLEKYPKLHAIIPLHKNPAVREIFYRELAEGERVRYTEPLDYPEFIRAMNRSTFMMSDSGGVQEEAAALKKPLLILRSLSERPEAVSEGTGIIVGTDKEKIVSTASRLLDEPDRLSSFAARSHNPFGDGTAARKIAKAVREHFGLL